MANTPKHNRIQQTAADQHLIDGFTDAASSITSLVIASAAVTTKDIVATLQSRIDSRKTVDSVMATLRSQLDALAFSFAHEIIAAIQSSSLHELVGASGTRASDGRKSRVVAGGGGQPDPLAVPKKTGKPGRLRRRSAEEISQMPGKIVCS